MVFPNIEKIKQEYTDKYVMVDPSGRSSRDLPTWWAR